MLTIEGYASLQQVYQLARHLVSEKMFERFVGLRKTWSERVHAEDDEKPTEPAGDEPKRSPFYYSNIEAAAQFLIYDLVRVQSKKASKSLQILRSDGNLIGLPVGQLIPQFRLKYPEEEYSQLRRWEAQEPGVKIGAGEHIFGLDTYRRDFWVDPFLFSQVFDEPSRRYSVSNGRLPFPAVDWNSGCVDLRRLRAYFAATEHFMQAITTFRSLGVTVPLSLERYSPGPVEFPRVLEPFDGCSVLVPTEWRDHLQKIDITAAASTREHTELKPKEAILAFIDAGSGATKKEIKIRTQELFPEMSHRKFDQIWTSISDERPELSRPGPRSKRRIETDF
jgi:hypothetical protein